MSATDGTGQIPFNNSAAVSFTSAPSPIPQTQTDYKNLETGFTNAINAQPTVQALTGGYNAQFGVPQLQSNVQNDQAQSDTIQGQIDNASKTVGQAAQQSIMTQGQKDAAVQNMTTPLQQRLTALQRDQQQQQAALSTAQTNSKDMVAAAQAQQTKQLQPWTQAFKDQDVIAAEQMTGWTNENANQLNVLLENQKAGVQLTQDQMDNMEKLSAQEQQFEDTLKTNAAQEQNSQNLYKFENPDPLGLFA